MPSRSGMWHYVLRLAVLTLSRLSTMTALEFIKNFRFRCRKKLPHPAISVTLSVLHCHFQLSLSEICCLFVH